MYVARILYPIQVLGPGNRIGIWTVSCKHHCKGCSNPELWNIDSKYFITVKDLERIIRNIAADNQIDGFTITGGEPIEQAAELSVFLDNVSDISKDVLLYTGYQLDDLQAEVQLLKYVAVIIDGEYIEELNDNCFLRGSSNQTINILNPEYRDLYTEYIKDNSNEIQNFMIGNEVISVGIHKRNFKF